MLRRTMSPREYTYVGPAAIAEAVSENDQGRVIASVRDALTWLDGRGTGPGRGVRGELVVTFVIDTGGRLRIAERRSEHVACAGGEHVLSAGEMTFARDRDGVEVVAVSNQSTGYCPESSSWPAVAGALDAIPLSHPGRFTAPFEFRRCEQCGERNVVKDDWFVCALCDAELPEAWNFA